VHAPPTPPHGYAPRPMRVHLWHHAASLFLTHSLLAAATTHVFGASGNCAPCTPATCSTHFYSLPAAFMCVLPPLHCQRILRLLPPQIPTRQAAGYRAGTTLRCWFAAMYGWRAS
jgi:hypothetical protein